MASQSGFSEGIVTVLFTDVEGSTGFGSRSGDEAARTVLRAHEEVVQRCVAEHGGRLIKSLGDGYMVAFGSTRKAISCGVAIQKGLGEMAEGRASLPLRIGINVGEVLDEGGDLFGSTVSAASRICAAASGGEILVSDMVKGLAGMMPDISFDDRGTVELKGFEEPWRLHRVVFSTDRSLDSFRRTPFIGRHKEREELRAFLERLGEGTGGLVAIGGEPGVGKTRLVEEFLEEGRRAGYRTLTGRCSEMESPTPYMPFIELLEAAGREVEPATFRLALGDAAGEIAKVVPQLRRLFDDIPPSLEMPPDQERRYLFNCIGEFVVRAGMDRPLIALLDDVHWADDSSLQLVNHIAANLEHTPVLVVATYRDTELGTHRPLARALEDLMRRRFVHRISLKRLATDGVSAMLERLAGSPPPEALVQAIYKETDGNAFFVEEVFRHLVEEGRIFDASGDWREEVTIGELEVPESVKLVLGHRLDRLGEATRKVLVAGAAIGYVFAFDLLEQVSNAGEEELLDAIDETRRAGLIAVTDRDDTEFKFVHELVRQTLLADVSAPRRQRLHLRVGEALEKRHSSDLEEHAAEIANHYMQAGGLAADATGRYLRLAAEHALQATAFDEALSFLTSALEFADDDDAETRAPLLFDLGVALRSLGRHEEAMDNWRAALALYEAIGDIGQIARVASETTFQLGWAARWEEAMEMGARGLASLGETDTPERSRVLSHISLGFMGLGQFEQSIAMVEDAMEIARRLDDKVLQGVADYARGFTGWGSLHYSEMILHGSEGSRLLEEEGEAWEWCNGGGFLAFALGGVGRLDEAECLLDRIEPPSERMGNAGALMMASRTRLMLANTRGAHLDVIEQLAEGDIAICREAELPWISQSYSILGVAKMYKGESAEALRLAEMGAATDPPGVVFGICHGFLFAIRAWVGEREAALGMLDEMDGLLPIVGERSPLGRWMALMYLVEGLFALGEQGDDRLLPLMNDAIALGLKLRGDGASVLAVAAMAAISVGIWDEAEAHLSDLESDIRTLEFPGHRAQLAQVRAELRARRKGPGDLVEARRLFGESSELWRAKGATFFADLTDSRARDL